MLPNNIKSDIQCFFLMQQENLSNVTLLFPQKYREEGRHKWWGFWGMALLSSEYVCLCFVNDSGWNKQNRNSVLCVVNSQGDPDMRREASPAKHYHYWLLSSQIVSFSITSILCFAISNWILVQLLQAWPRY